MLKNAYIISWFGNASVANHRRDYHKRQVAWMLGQGLNITIFAQAYEKDDYIDDDRITYVEGQKDTVLSPGEARNILLDRFYESEHAWAIFADNDAVWANAGHGVDFIETFNRNPSAYDGVDLFVPLNPQFERYNSLWAKDSHLYRTSHVFCRTASIKGSLMVIRNLKKAHGQQLHFDPSFSASSTGGILGGEDGDFGLKLIGEGLGVYRCQSLVLEEYGSDRYSTWCCNRSDRTNQLLEANQTILSNHADKGLSLSDGRINWAAFIRDNATGPSKIVVPITSQHEISVVELVKYFRAKNKAEQNPIDPVFDEPKNQRDLVVEACEELRRVTKMQRKQLYRALELVFEWIDLGINDTRHRDYLNQHVRKTLGGAFADFDLSKLSLRKATIGVLKATVLVGDPDADQSASFYADAMDWGRRRKLTRDGLGRELEVKGISGCQRAEQDARQVEHQNKVIISGERSEADDMAAHLASYHSVATFSSESFVDPGDGYALALLRFRDGDEADLIDVIRQTPALQDRVEDAIGEIYARDRMATSPIGPLLTALEISKFYLGRAQKLNLQIAAANDNATFELQNIGRTEKPAQRVFAVTKKPICQPAYVGHYALEGEKIEELAAAAKAYGPEAHWSLGRDDGGQEGPGAIRPRFLGRCRKETRQIMLAHGESVHMRALASPQPYRWAVQISLSSWLRFHKQISEHKELSSLFFKKDLLQAKLGKDGAQTTDIQVTETRVSQDVEQPMAYKILKPVASILKSTEATSVWFSGCEKLFNIRIGAIEADYVIQFDKGRIANDR